MGYENGKRYTFTSKQFAMSREYGRLYFLIDDPASATPFRVAPFEFQKTKKPDKLVCIYRGGKFEQDTVDAAQSFYQIGDVRQFVVLRQDGNGPATLSDDAAGLRFWPVDLGKVHFERFKRIQCRIAGFADGRLQVEYIKPKAKPRAAFDLKALFDRPELRLLRRKGLVDAFLAHEVLKDAKAQRAAGDPAWVITALDAVRRYLPQWMGANPRRRIAGVEAVRNLAVALIENSAYLDEFELDTRIARQQQLSEFITDCDDYASAARLIADGREEDFITDTLTSIRRTGWLYDPERRMRLIMALLAMRSGYSASHIEEILALVRERRTQPGFLDAFGAGLRVMLSTYIDNEADNIDMQQRRSVRNLIEVIAMELLLTHDLDQTLPKWSLHRGMLYSLAYLLVKNADSPLAVKAFATLAGHDEPLEFGWADLDDITRLCHVRLAQVTATDNTDLHSAYDGLGASLAIEPTSTDIVPEAELPNARPAYEMPLFSTMMLRVMLNARIDKAPAQADNLVERRQAWDAVYKSLAATPTAAQIAEANKPDAAEAADNTPRTPRPGDEVDITISFVRGRDQSDYECHIVDDRYDKSVPGYITYRDFVPYNMTFNRGTFRSGDGYGPEYILRATVLEIVDERVHFSLFEGLRQLMLSYAEEDQANNNVEILGRITGTPNEGKPNIQGVSDWGYPFLMPAMAATSHLRKDDFVNIRIKDVNTGPNDDKLYINAILLDDVDPAEIEDSYERANPVSHWFKKLIRNYAQDRVYDPKAAQKAEPVEVAEPETAPVDEVSVTYLPTPSVTEISRLLDIMAHVEAADAARAYDLLALARLLALMAGNGWRAGHLTFKMRLMEAMQYFAVNARVDNEAVAQLESDANEYMRLNDPDVTQRMQILRTLARIDAPAEAANALPTAEVSPLVAELRRLVTSYNLLRGMQLNDARQQILDRIFAQLNLKPKRIDVTRINANEDHFNEFKTSMFFPPENNMKPDETRQGLEIVRGVCALLNADGGTLYLGVANLGEVTGLHNDFVYLNRGNESYDIDDMRDRMTLAFGALMRRHVGSVYEGVQLSPQYVDLEFEEINGQWIARIAVHPYPGLVRLSATGDVWIRGMANKEQLPAKKQPQYLKNRQAKSAAPTLRPL